MIVCAESEDWDNVSKFLNVVTSCTVGIGWNGVLTRGGRVPRDKTTVGSTRTLPSVVTRTSGILDLAGTVGSTVANGNLVLDGNVGIT